MSTHYGITMPHFEAKRQVILKEEDVPTGYTLKEIYEAMKDKQFPIKFRKGKSTAAYKIGMIIKADLGRDAIVADLGLDPVFTLILDKVLVPSEEEGVEDLITVVKHLEWNA